jgi:hypothetical protein
LKYRYIFESENIESALLHPSSAECLREAQRDPYTFLGISHGIDDYAQRNDNEGENILMKMRYLSSGICRACYLKSYHCTAVIAADDDDSDHAKHDAANAVYSGFRATGLKMYSVSLSIHDWITFIHVHISQCKH